MFHFYTCEICNQTLKFYELCIHPLKPAWDEDKEGAAGGDAPLITVDKKTK